MLYGFFFNDTATTEIYTLSLHDALPISIISVLSDSEEFDVGTDYLIDLLWETELFDDYSDDEMAEMIDRLLDRKSTRLNSSHANISYAVFCLKKKHNPANPSSTIFLLTP